MMGISRKYYVVCSMGILFLIITLLPTTIRQLADQLPTVLAQSQDCGGGSQPRAQGLVTSPSVSGKFGTTGGCIVDSKTVFVPYKIPTYADLKSIYYDQSKFTAKESRNSLPGSFNGDKVFLITSDLSINANLTGSGTQVIFVEGKLSINKNIIFHTQDGAGGLVFVISNDVFIDKDVTQIDSVIISEGKIYTAATSGSTCSSTTPVQTLAPLVINGSLISINQTEPQAIRFCRTLVDNTQAAEKINAQVKYLVTLRNMLSDTLQRWSEVAATTPTTPPTVGLLPVSDISPPLPPPPTCSSGLLSNGCFENQLANWDCNGADSGNCTFDSTVKYAGTYAAKVTGTGGSWGRQINQGNISYTPGASFCLSVRVKKQNAGDNVKVAIQQFDVWSAVEESTANTTDWQLVKKTFTVPGSWSKNIQVYLRQYSNSVVWFDDASFTQGSCP